MSLRANQQLLGKAEQQLEALKAEVRFAGTYILITKPFELQRIY